jgi:hypothetical protein
MSKGSTHARHPIRLAQCHKDAVILVHVCNPQRLSISQSAACKTSSSIRPRSRDSFCNSSVQSIASDEYSYVACQQSQRLYSFRPRHISTQFRLDHNIPFRAPWKKNLTMKTWRPAMVRISPLSIKLNVKMRPSVLLTVLKFLFSRVRKYFWLREMVLSCAESLRMDSSRTVVCSGEDPCLAGMMARAASFSTCRRIVSIAPFM